MQGFISLSLGQTGLKLNEWSLLKRKVRRDHTQLVNVVSVLSFVNFLVSPLSGIRTDNSEQTDKSVW